MFYFTISGIVMTSLYLGIEAGILKPGFRLLEQYTGEQILIAIAASAFDTSALVFMTLAYQSDSSGFVALLSYMNIVYAFLCD